MAMAKLSVSKCRCSIWHHQQSTTSFSQPPTIHNNWHHRATSPPSPRHHIPMSPPSPTATAAHSCHRPPTTTAHDHQQQCGNTTSLAATTTRTDNPKWWTMPKHQTMPTNEYEGPYHSQMMASTYEQTQVTTSWGETACLPPIHFSDTESRCHVADSDVATKWRTTMSFVVVVRRPWWVPPIPCSSQPTLLRHWMMMDWRRG